MIIFIDTSAWIKYFIEEKGTQEIQEFILEKSSLGLNRFSASAVTYAEMHATLKRANNGKRITEQQYNQAIISFEEQWDNVDVPDVDDALIKKSGDLAKKYALKGCDAFQLASALSIKASIFVNSDEDLRKAAQDSGLKIFNPATDHFLL